MTTWLLSLSIVSKQRQNIDLKIKTLNVITLRRWQGGQARPVMPIAHRQRAQALLLPWTLSVQPTTRLPHRYYVVCSIRLWGMCKAFRRGMAWRMQQMEWYRFGTLEKRLVWQFLSPKELKSERISPFWVGGYPPFSASMGRIMHSVFRSGTIRPL